MMNIQKINSIVHKSAYLKSLWYWYKQIATELGFVKPISHAADNYGYVLKSIILFLPIVCIGIVWTIIGGGKCKKVNNADNNSKFDYELVFVAIIKNEAPYLEEWIVFHHMLGVDRFVIYDNESTDEPLSVLQKYIDKGWIEYKYWPGKAQQVITYTDALNRYRAKTRYIGFIDLDEFVFPINENSISKFVYNTLLKKPSAGGVCIPWYNYGTSNLKKRSKGLVIEKFIHRAVFGFIPNIKTIGNPRLMKCCLNPHIPIWKYGTCNVDEWGRKTRNTNAVDNKEPNGIRINHYYTKSEEEYWTKLERGMADGYGKRPQNVRYFNFRNRNEIKDIEILRFLPLLKEEFTKEYSDKKQESVSE